MKLATHYDVFLSYSHKDSDAANAIDVALRGAGLSVFLDDRDIRPGETIIDRVFEGLTNADAQLVLLSQASVESGWVMEELAAGRTRAIGAAFRVIPVVISDCEIPRAIAHIKYLKFVDWQTDRSFRRGISELLFALGRESAPPSDVAIEWAARYAVEIVQLDRELTYLRGCLDGGIDEGVGGNHTWMAHKLALNEVPLGLFLLDDIDDEPIRWPREILESVAGARDCGEGLVPGGLTVIKHWLLATGFPSDVSRMVVLSESVDVLLAHLDFVGIAPWRKVRLSRVDDGAKDEEGIPFYVQVRQFGEVMRQFTADLTPLVWPSTRWRPRFAGDSDSATRATPARDDASFA